ncbi:MAG: tetratricopeptide repeat protein [Candidatus Tectimicrobiota bacterium]
MRPLGFLLLVLLLSGAPGQAAPTQADLLEPLQQALHSVYDMAFESAVQQAQALRERAPQHPAGFFVLAATYWQWRLVTGEAQPRSQLLAQFQEAIQQTRALAERLPEAQAAEAAFYLGAASGMQARMHFVEKQYIRALLAAKQGSAALQRCVRLVPTWYDAYAGLGTYHYVLARVPAFWRGVVQQLIGLPGDRRRGLQALEQARRHGQLAVPEATLLLAKIYTLPEEGQYEQAASLLASLAQRYPHNLDYRYRLLLAYTALERWEQAQQVTQHLLTDLQQSQAAYAQDWLPIVHYRQAEIALFQRQVASAAAQLHGLQTHELLPSLRAWVELRLGNVYDLRHERQTARAWYSGVSGDPTAEQLARLYLGRPFMWDFSITKPIEQSAI